MLSLLSSSSPRKRKMGRGTTLGVYLKAISSSGSLLLLLLYFHGGIITEASASASTTTVFPTKTEQKCDKVVLVETPELLSYLGNVTFIVPIPYKGKWSTLIKFTSPFTFIGGWGVVVESYGRKGYASFVSNVDEDLKEGDELVFQFRVLYGRNAKVPKVLSIRWQDVPICGPPILEAVDSQISTESRMRSSQESPEDEQGNNSDEGGDNDVDEDEIRDHINSNNIRIMN